jgi:hypothetical protein
MLARAEGLTGLQTQYRSGRPCALGRSRLNRRCLGSDDERARLDPGRRLRLDRANLGLKLGAGACARPGCQTRAALSAVSTRASRKGTLRRRTPVASWIAFATAAMSGLHAVSPPPYGGRSGRFGFGSPFNNTTSILAGLSACRRLG